MDRTTGSMDVETLVPAAGGVRRGPLVIAGVVGLVFVIGTIVAIVVLGGGAPTVTPTTTTTTTVTTTTTTTKLPKPSSQNPIRGVCYAPLPCTSHARCRLGIGTPEDMTEPGYAKMWDASGRGDFGIIKAMGANTIRVYHPMGEEISFPKNKTEPDRTQFLAAVKTAGLNVFGGVHQSLPCPNDDCFASWYKAVTLGLASGFAVDFAWHESVWAINMINEVDAMVNQNPQAYVKRIVSAVDGLLAAEQWAGLMMQREMPVKLTSCFTTGINAPLGTDAASIFHGFSSMEAWIKNPRLVSYTPRAVSSLTDFVALLEGRWLHCINAQVPWHQILELIPKDFTKVGMGQRPWFIGEMGFNGEHGDKITKDLEAMQTYAVEGNTSYIGTLFFQFQTAYWKTGAELNFGMFGLADTLGYSATIAETPWQKKKRGTTPMLDIKVVGIRIQSRFMRWQAGRMQQPSASCGSCMEGKSCRRGAVLGRCSDWAELRRPH